MYLIIDCWDLDKREELDKVLVLVELESVLIRDKVDSFFITGTWSGILIYWLIYSKYLFPFFTLIEYFGTCLGKLVKEFLLLINKLEFKAELVLYIFAILSLEVLKPLFNH